VIVARASRLPCRRSTVSVLIDFGEELDQALTVLDDDEVLTLALEPSAATRTDVGHDARTSGSASAEVESARDWTL